MLHGSQRSVYVRRVAPVPGGLPGSLEPEHGGQLCADKGAIDSFMGAQTGAGKSIAVSGTGRER
jgi:hypothetical protein